MKRFVSVTLLVLLSLSFACAKDGEGQEVNTTASVTHDLMRFAGNIHQFNSIFPQEKVYLQFDNTSYYTGETIWFKAFVVNASTLRKAQSQVLYVDLISPTGVLLKQQKLKIVAGQADGSFVLMDGSTSQAREKRGVLDYPSGFYEVRAYTNYMLNFSEEALFSRVFAVYEKPQVNGNYYAEAPVIKNRLSDGTDVRPKTESLRKINCNFYPEGGHIIIGKQCRVAFKVTDGTGFGIDADGRLNGTDIKFSTIHDGMGWFTFTPQEKRNQVELTIDGKSYTFSLPAAEQEGCAMMVMADDTDSIILKIDCTPQLVGTTLGLGLTCRGELVGFDTCQTEAGSVEKVMSMQGVPEGVCRVYLFDDDGKIYASRSVYHHSSVMATPSIDVYTDKDKYGPFEKVSLQFSLKDGNGNPFRDRFCLSVRDMRGQGNILADDLRTSMLLSSDLKGFIENPSWYFDSDDPQRDTALDLLMLVQGWERYDWQTMTGQKEFREKHRVEENLTMNGWIMNSSGRKPLENIEVLASLMPNDKRLSESYSYVTDSSGYFGFDIGPDLYDKARFSIRAQPERKRLVGPDARIVFDRSMLPSIRAYMPQELVFSGLQSISRKRGKTMADLGEYEQETVISEDKGIVLPDVEIEEDRMYVDYFTFKAFDVVKDVEIELDKGDYSTDLEGYLSDKGLDVFVWQEFNPATGTDTTKMTINGFDPFFYVHDSKRYLYTGTFGDDVISRLAIESMDIKSIIVFDRPMLLPQIMEQCPLYTKSQRYKEEYQDFIMDPNKSNAFIDSFLISKRLILLDIQIKEPHELSTKDEILSINNRVTTVDGFSRPYEFYSPEYPNGPIPGDVDYRRTLYWNPNVITDSIGNARVEFYNSSITNHFNVSAAGITASGVPYVLDQNW